MINIKVISPPSEIDDFDEGSPSDNEATYDMQLLLEKFPDSTQRIGLMSLPESVHDTIEIQWKYDNDEELVKIMYLVGHIRENFNNPIALYMPYIPNARMDRVKSTSEVFTLKHFCSIINSLKFDYVTVLDPHSFVSEGLINRIEVIQPTAYINQALSQMHRWSVKKEDLVMFYPDEGAVKRYSSLVQNPFSFGIKKRNWSDGKITSIEVQEGSASVEGKPVFIIDDICSYGGTFTRSARALKAKGATDIFLYVTHCEDSILKGELLTSGLINHVFTTDSIVREAAVSLAITVFKEAEI
jgi:ribose-phosphate pyrophosphokinase